MPIPITIPLGEKSALAHNVMLSPTQTHHRRRASVPAWPPPSASQHATAAAGDDYMLRRSTVADTASGVTSPPFPISPSLYGCSPEQYIPAGFKVQPPFMHTCCRHPSSASTNNNVSPRTTPAPSSQDNFPVDAPLHPYDVVYCDHHHHRRQSVAVRFLPPTPQSSGPEGMQANIADESLMMMFERWPKERRLSGHFARPPSPTGERILKGDVSF
ncbi:uncharacterized protein V1518DRAFT_439149 [Limtongia smithiae]|uniref:uncharacterized protein n=1 Tax=Limtongia smithiae TaxID=1125753 RepID=UPI0034CDE107